MAKPIVSDKLWAISQPLMPLYKPRSKGGRPLILDWAALTGILFVLMIGSPYEMLPPEMGCGTGWRHLCDWQKAGVWDRLHPVCLDQLGQPDRIDWSWLRVRHERRADIHKAFLKIGVRSSAGTSSNDGFI